MAPSLLFFFFFFFPCSCISDHVHLQCPSKFTCRGLDDDVHFPFSNTSYPDCGLIILNCSDEHDVRVQFSKPHGTWYIVERSSNTEIVLRDEILKDQLNSNDCNSLNNFTLPLSSSIVFQFISPLLPFFKCKRGYSNSSHPNLLKNLKNYTRCSNSDLYFSGDHEKSLPSLPENCSDFCSVIQLPAVEWDPSKARENLMSLWSFMFILKWEILPECNNCYKKGGLCLNNSDGSFKCSGSSLCLNNRDGSFKCSRSSKQDNKKAMKIGVGIAGGVGGILLTCVAFFIYQRRRKLRSISSTLLSQTISSEPSSKPDLENGSMFHLTPIFKYDELVEATENFHSSKELGDGGFGTVYYGKLQDGRVVAVKRLYEHNYKRVEQFMNEIKILSLLRHPHLVFLYGCTSHDSRELLLVYEYVPNGTVADHLHGQRAKAGSLPWPVRMNIAIETADALAYLHATDIIHRDVKTTNILLDNNFHVKVADFGLSRLFPNDATHVSTAPQGTPGYVDPEYYQCYQLNSKSDVYSFGVVLIELISSKPAVDISRHRHEINLANMAVNKILNHALHELVDPSLGFESDYTVRRMITLVAELAFRCLQQEKEMRPTMKEVLECLKQIQSDEHTIENRDELDVGAEKGLLKGMNPPFSPNSVTDKWASVSTTPNTSA